jgi:BirA family biotin operon repressor/biotin-[acetyl-CoA-carboxylase] ligase
VPLDTGRLEELIRDNRLVTRLVVSPELVSTQDEARRLADAGAASGTVVLAHRQTGGRGSRGRRWHSPEGTGLYFSILLAQGADPDSPARWTLAASLAVCRACREYGLPAVIKWPNDILIRGRKVAGILAELRSGRGAPVLALGIGVNVGQAATDFPTELTATATSLLIEGCVDCGREELAGSILAHLSTVSGLMYHGDWHTIREDWIAMACGIHGVAVRLRNDSGEPAGLNGITAGIDEGGALIVKLEDGSSTVVHSSESLARMEA